VCREWPVQHAGGCLRHTAACLWLARGVDPVTVQAWMGHTSIATTDLYLRYLGSSADRAGLARLNDRGRTGANGGRTLANGIGPIHRLPTRNA
jgi:hypothetical protein